MSAQFDFLNAFAARQLEGKARVNLSIAELQSQGYDTELLLELVRDYQRAPNARREFMFFASASALSIASAKPVH